MEQEFVVVAGDSGELVFQDKEGVQVNRIEGAWFKDGASVILNALGQEFEFRIRRGVTLRLHEEYGLFKGDFFAQRFISQTSSKALFVSWLEEGDKVRFDNSMLAKKSEQS